MIKTAVIHPSYGRPVMAFNTYNEWLNAADHPEEAEYIIGMDDNDPSISQYQSRFAITTSPAFARTEINIGPSRSGVAAVNRMATVLSPTTELIVTGGDDMSPCPHWDTELMNLLKGVDNFNDPKFLSVSDGLRGYGVVYVYLIVNRAWYNKLGYMLWPEYDGMFADNDMMAVANILNAVIHAPQLTFQHRHYSLGLTPFDATYARNNNQVNWDKNHQVYIRRSQRHFDL